MFRVVNFGFSLWQTNFQKQFWIQGKSTRKWLLWVDVWVFSIHRDEMWIVPFTIPHKWQTYSSHQSYLLAVNFPPLRCLHYEERRKSSSSGTTRSAMMFAINVFWLLHWNAVLCECQIHRRIHKTFHCWIFLWRNFPKHKKRNFSLFVWWNHLLHHENHKN